MVNRDAPVIPIAASQVASGLGARSDDELMRLAGAGVLEAFEEIVRRYEQRVRAFCNRMLGGGRAGVERADDVAQDVFLNVWQSSTRYDARNRFCAFLFTSARNACLRALRDTVEHAELEEHHIVAPSEQLDALLAAERRQRMEHLIGRLRPKLRDAIWLRFAGELEYAEIAAVLGCPEQTVRSRVFLGLKRLRKMLARTDERSRS